MSRNTITSQMSHWPCVKLSAHTVAMSAIEASQKERDETETVSAMASLSMQQPTNLTLVLNVLFHLFILRVYAMRARARTMK